MSEAEDNTKGKTFKHLAEKLALVEPEYRARLYDALERDRLKSKPKKRRAKGKGKKPFLISGGAYGLGESRKH